MGHGFEHDVFVRADLLGGELQRPHVLAALSWAFIAAKLLRFSRGEPQSKKEGFQEAYLFELRSESLDLKQNSSILPRTDPSKLLRWRALKGYLEKAKVANIHISNHR